MFSSCQGAADQGEGAQSSAAVRAHRGGALEAPGGAEAERGAPQGCGGGEEEAAAGGGEGQIAQIFHLYVCNTFLHMISTIKTKNILKYLIRNIRGFLVNIFIPNVLPESS